MDAFRTLAFFVAVGISLLGCAAEEGEEEVLETKDAFVERELSWLRNQSIIEAATKRPVRVKLEHERPLTKQWVGLFAKGMNTWFAPLRELPGGADLTRQVVIVQKDEDIVLQIKPGDGRAYYSTGSMIAKQRIELYELNTYETLLHEIGHAVGLGDAYVEGIWTCKPGQPDSIMCHSDASELRADDIRGVRFEYCQRSKRCDENRFKDTYGGGGKDFASTCPPGAHLAGLDVRLGWVVDSVSPICEYGESGTRKR
jgi:hypothetical protein